MNRYHFCFFAFFLHFNKHTMSADDSIVAPILIEPKSEHRKTVIFVHGVASDGMRWHEKIANFLDDSWRVIIPTAPLMPVTLRNNEVIRSWFDIREVRFEGDEDGPGIEKAAAYIRSLIENEIQVNKVESNRIVLAGYSQGAILTLYTALTHDKPLGGAVAISGWLPLAKRFPADVNEANKQIHFFQMHGDQDEVVPIQVFRQSRAYVENNHIADFTFKVYSGMGHDPSKELLEDVQNYINQL